MAGRLLDFGAQRLREQLRAKKGLRPDTDLSLWQGRALVSLCWTLATRLARGVVVGARLGTCGGRVLAERAVRMHHPRYISAGRELILQEGVEIVGLSRQGVVFGNRCTIGRFATIRPTSVLFGNPGEGLRMGDNSNIGAFSFVGCSGLIEIGSNVMMGPGVTLLSENHVFSSIDVPIKKQGVSRSSISISDDCWIGANAMILAGVSIGTGAIVAGGAIVTRDVEPFAIVAGSPARLVRYRTPEKDGGGVS